MNETIGKLNNLYKSYHKKQVVNNLSFLIKKGKITGLLGPNGAGKTTTLRMLMGISKPDKGQIEIFGRNITENREFILKNTGALIDLPALYGNLRAEENLKLICLMKGINFSEIYPILKLVGLTDCCNKKVRNFSLGMKQRLGIAIALIGRPDLVILDEPVNALDPEGIQEIRELIKKLANEQKITFLISSHLLSEMQLIAEDVHILKKGSIIYSGKLKSLLNDKSKIKLGVNNVSQAMKQLADYNVRAEIQQDGIVIDHGNSIERITKILVDSGIGINYIFDDTNSLEDIYLKLINE